MKYLFILIFCFSMCYHSTYAILGETYESLLKQNTEKSLDSLYNILKSNISDTNSRYIKGFYEKGIKHSSEKIIFKSYKLLGDFYRNINNPDSAKIIYNQSIDYNYKNEDYQIKSYESLVSILTLLKQFDEAIEILIPLINKTKDNPDERANIYSLIANVYRSNNMLDKSIEYLQKAYELKKIENDKSTMAKLSVNFIALYALNGDFEKASEYGKRAIEFYEELGNNERIGDIYMNLGYISFSTKDYHQAIKYYEESLKIEQESQNTAEDVIGLLNNISRCYINLGETKKSIESLERILEFKNMNYYNSNTYHALEVAHYNLLQEKLESNNIKDALVAFNKLSYYSTQYDSLYRIENDAKMKNAVAEAAAKLENQKLSNEMIVSESKKELAERRIIYLLILMLLFVVFVIILIIQNNKKKHLANELRQREKKLTHLNSDLFDKIDKLIKSVAFKDKLLSVISHDLQAPVKSIEMLSDAIVKNGDNLDKNQIIKKSKTFNEISIELNILLNNLMTWIKSHGHSINVEKTNFNIRELSDDITKLYRKTAREKNISIINNIYPDVFVYADRNMIATVLRNLLSNAIKFSDENKNITLSSEIIDSKIKISVIDEGKGIEDEKLKRIFNLDKKDITPESNAIGLKISREFIEMNEGEIFAKSNLGEGSEFGFSINRQKT